MFIIHYPSSSGSQRDKRSDCPARRDDRLTSMLPTGSQDHSQPEGLRTTGSGIDHKTYIRKYGHNMHEICNWNWGPTATTQCACRAIVWLVDVAIV
jgi:hypothetical protein